MPHNEITILKNGIQEVESSILFVSTKRPVTCWQVFFIQKWT